MSDETKLIIKNNWISATTLFFVLGIFVQQIRWQSNVDNKIQKLEEHSNNQVIHMSYEKQSVIFVPRIEIDSRLNNIQNTLDKIESKLDRK